MELDERPTEEYSDIGGLDKQIEEVINYTTHISSVVPSPNSTTKVNWFELSLIFLLYNFGNNVKNTAWYNYASLL